MYEPAEAAVLRLLADLYVQSVNTESAIRCLERVVLLDARYGLSQHSSDMANLERLVQGDV